MVSAGRRRRGQAQVPIEEIGGVLTGSDPGELVLTGFLQRRWAELAVFPGVGNFRFV